MFSNESAGHEIFRNELALGLFFLKSTDSVMVASHQWIAKVWTKWSPGKKGSADYYKA